MNPGVTPLAKTTFSESGFVVLRQFFDAQALAAEMKRVLNDAASRVQRRFQYAPMMTAETANSLALLDRAEVVAAALLGGPVLPTRAKGVRYSGDTSWHADSELPVVSLGVAAYLEPLSAETGALRVIPGSHRHELEGAPERLPKHVIATEPGDLIFFHEHLLHASFGGGVRRQWRADFVRDPVTAEEEEQTRQYFERLFPPDWDGGYDVDRYPSYGAEWRASGRQSVGRLEALGVYEMAARQEEFSRRLHHVNILGLG